MPLTYRPPKELEEKLDAFAFLTSWSKQEILDTALRRYLASKPQDTQDRINAAVQVQRKAQKKHA